MHYPQIDLNDTFLFLHIYIFLNIFVNVCQKLKCENDFKIHKFYEFYIFIISHHILLCQYAIKTNNRCEMSPCINDLFVKLVGSY